MPMNLPKSCIIVLGLAAYWIFIYYRYHYADSTPISIVAASVAALFAGAYAVLIDKTVALQDIKLVYAASALFLLGSYALILLAVRKQPLNPRIDITLSWIDRTFGRRHVYAGVILSFPAFVLIVAGTRKILGAEHLWFWIMVFCAWFVSGVRLFRTTRNWYEPRRLEVRAACGQGGDAAGAEDVRGPGQA